MQFFLHSSIVFAIDTFNTMKESLVEANPVGVEKRQELTTMIAFDWAVSGAENETVPRVMASGTLQSTMPISFFNIR